MKQSSIPSHTLIRIIGPGFEYFQNDIEKLDTIYKETALLHMKIGDGIQKIDPATLTDLLKNSMHGHVRMDVLGHGDIDREMLYIKLDGRFHPITVLFDAISNAASEMKPISLQLHMWNCFGGKAVEYLSFLPRNVVLATYTREDSHSFTDMSLEGITHGIRKFAENINPFVAYANHIFTSPETSTIACKEFKFSARPPVEFIASTSEIRRYLLDFLLPSFHDSLRLSGMEVSSIIPDLDNIHLKKYQYSACHTENNIRSDSYIRDIFQKTDWHPDADYLRGNLHCTLLHKVARFGSVASLNLLITAGADVNAVDDYGQNALHYAIGRPAKHQHIMALLHAGTHVNAKNTHTDMAPIHIALYGAYDDYIRMLYQHEAILPNITCKGNSCLHIVLKNMLTNISVIDPKCKASFSLLLAHKDIDTNIQDSEYNATPVMYAIEYARKTNDYFYAFILLADHRTDPTIPDKRGFSTLHLAAADNNAVLIRAILANKKSNANVANSLTGDTALDILASKQGTSEATEILIAHGANKQSYRNKIKPTSSSYGARLRLISDGDRDGDGDRVKVISRVSRKQNPEGSVISPPQCYGL